MPHKRDSYLIAAYATTHKPWMLYVTDTWPNFTLLYTNTLAVEPARTGEMKTCPPGPVIFMGTIHACDIENKKYPDSRKPRPGSHDPGPGK